MSLNTNKARFYRADLFLMILLPGRRRGKRAPLESFGASYDYLEICIRIKRYCGHAL